MRMVTYWLVSVSFSLACTACTEASLVGTQSAQIEFPGATGFAMINADGTVVSAHSYNSSGGAVSVSKLGALYAARFAGIGAEGGIAQVVAYGTDNVRCQLRYVEFDDPDQVVWYVCHDPSGTTQDSAAIVQYYRADASSLGGAYVFADDASAPFEYCPSSVSWNSEGGANCIQRTGTGTYDVILGGLAEQAGSVQVTSFGDSGEYCNVAGWGPAPMPDTGAQRVQVACYDTSGLAEDSRFMLNYHEHQQIEVEGIGAYAWLNDSTSSSYTPNSTYSFNANDSECFSTVDIAAGRSATGQYFVIYDDKGGSGTTVHVTAYGSSRYCKVRDLNAIADGAGWTDDAEVLVDCYDSSGNGADTQYVQSLATNWQYVICFASGETGSNG